MRPRQLWVILQLMTPEKKEIRDRPPVGEFCSGCGLCVGVCPRRALEMRFDEAGELKPFRLDDRCGESCRLCRQVCPFNDELPNEDALGREFFAATPGIARHPITGFFLECLAGYSRACREGGASGGLATWTLQALLERGEVDAVACVAPHEGGHPLFEFTLCRTPEQVRSCARSAYYPVHLGHIVRQILDTPGRYAVIALPCVCKALRLAMRRLPILRERIRYVLGLVCGQTKSALFAEWVCARGGGQPGCLRSIRFRLKTPGRSATDHAAAFGCGDGRENTVFWSQGIGDIWSDRYFTLQACEYCDDVFAECADAVFMDAWLPRFVTDHRGHNLVLVRRAELADLLRSSPGECVVQDISLADVIASQAGVINDKRLDIRHRLRLARTAGPHPPRKREHLFDREVLLGRKRLVAARWHAARMSPLLWRESAGSLDRFAAAASPLRLGLSVARRNLRRLRIFNAVLRRLFIRRTRVAR